MIKNNLLMETDLGAAVDPAGVISYSKYLIPVIGPIFAAIDAIGTALGTDTTSSQGFYDYTKAYINKNPNGFTVDQEYNIEVTIGRYYTAIQRQRELTQDETNQANELISMAQNILPVDNPVARVTPATPDYGAAIPTPITIPDFNPFAGIGTFLAQYKWVFIVAGGLLTLYVATPLITTIIKARAK